MCLSLSSFSLSLSRSVFLFLLPSDLKNPTERSRFNRQYYTFLMYTEPHRQYLYCWLHITRIQIPFPEFISYMLSLYTWDINGWPFIPPLISFWRSFNNATHYFDLARYTTNSAKAATNRIKNRMRTCLFPTSGKIQKLARQCNECSLLYPACLVK